LVKKGDTHTKSDIKTGTERSEIYLDPELHGDELNKEIWYYFGLFIPKTFPITKTRLVVGQWKSHDTESPGYSPSISNRFEKGEFIVKLKVKPGIKEYHIPSFVQGSWNDFIYRIVLSTSHGILDVWLGGKQVLRYRGPTAVVDRVHLFKMGLYRDSFEEDMTAYFSNFKRSDSPPESISLIHSAGAL